MSVMIDYESAMERLGNDHEFFIELLQELVGQVDSNISQMRAAIQEKRLDDLSRQAHGLKGASANLSVIGLTKLFERLEKESKAGILDNPVQLLQDIESANEDLKEYIKVN